MKTLIATPNTDGILAFRTTPEIRRRAEIEFNERFSNDLSINRKTVYNRRESRIAGILGEVVFKELYPEAVKSTKDITYDFDLAGKKVDVKCKFRTVVPKLNFEASFFLYQANKIFNADLYYFMSTTPSFEYVWLCGWATKDGILQNPNREIWRAGETDPSNGMTFREDTMCLKYKYLNRINNNGNGF